MTTQQCIQLNTGLKEIQQLWLKYNLYSDCVNPIIQNFRCYPYHFYSSTSKTIKKICLTASFLQHSIHKRIHTNIRNIAHFPVYLSVVYNNCRK